MSLQNDVNSLKKAGGHSVIAKFHPHGETFVSFYVEAKINNKFVPVLGPYQDRQVANRAARKYADDNDVITRVVAFQ